MTRLAVLIDADNICAAFAPAITKHVSGLGTPVTKRAYGKQAAMTDWAQAGREMLCEMRLLINLGPGKNGTDIALAIEAMDILQASVADSFCIVSNDRDFVPLAVRLRASGKAVHAICKQADANYRLAFDSVFELETVRHPIVDAYRELAAGRPDMGLGEVGHLLRQQLPGVIPTTGKSPLRRALLDTGQLVITGEGSNMRVKLGE